MTTPSRLRATGIALALLTVLVMAAIGLPAAAQDDPTGEPVTPGDPTGEPVTPGDPVPTSRLAGPTRIDTAVAISQRAFPSGAPTAYLANADVTVDAVAGGSLTDGPVLLVPTCTLPDEVAAELARLAPGEVIALGGAAAICDDVLAEAAQAAADGSPGEPGDRPDHVVAASAELVDASATPPFTVEATDPGILFEGGTFDMQVRFTGTDGDVVLDDPRFSAVLQDGDGQLVVAGPGCSPVPDGDDVAIACTEELNLVEVTEGGTTAIDVQIHTDDEEVGETPVTDGTYVLDQPVRWSVGTAADDPTFTDGEVTVRITWTVTTPDGPGDPGDDPTEEPGTEVVEWDTPEGSFRTTGHSDFDLARIAEGVEAGEHIGIPNGEIRRGDGGVNTSHDWHLVDIELVDQTIEVCDGTADYVDAHLEDYLAIGRYCPWGAVPTSITP